jgi:prephenate dehydrogenase
MMKFEKVAILGPGLIGASFGLALKRQGLAKEIVGLARRESTLKAARAVGGIDAGATKLEDAIAGADLIFLATPVLAAIDALEAIGKLAHLFAGKKVILTDACSTKVELVEAAGKLPAGLSFVGGHPMAGAELAGPEQARADLFCGATWILTPTTDSEEATTFAVQELVCALGAKPLQLSPEEHDTLVAAVSHLPHLLAVALMTQAAEAGEEKPEIWQVAASGFRDMTRLAAGSAEVWKDICLTNKASLIRALEEFRARLEGLEKVIAGDEAEALLEILQNANVAHRRIE